MTALIYILKSFLLGWLLASFEPLQELIKPLKTRVSDKHFSIFYLKTAVSCHKCLAFWSGIMLSGSIYVAAAASILAFVFDKYTSK
jgi:hypothetical protein